MLAVWKLATPRLAREKRKERKESNLDLFMPNKATLEKKEREKDISSNPENKEMGKKGKVPFLKK